MALNNNPFYLLKVSCSAGRREIVSASEEMSFLLDSETCSRAQNELINLNKRLSAEINWFIDADTNMLDSIRESIESGEPISTDMLSGLSELNATLFNFSLSNGEDSYELGYSILEIDELYSALDPDEITDRINQNRNEAKLGVVQVQDVAAELGKKREEIRQLITEKLSSIDQDTYIELVTMLAEKCIADDEYDDGVVLSDVIDQYEVRMQSALEESADEIEKHIERIKNLANDSAVSGNVDSLIHRVKKWDILAQPLQLKSQASGMPHEISEHLGSELRNLALYLHNERGLTKEALTLVNAMKSVFAELGVLSELFETDSDALNDLLKGQKEAEEIVNEFKSLQDESESVKNYPGLSKVNSYVERIKNLDRRLKTIDLDAEMRTKTRENLCYMARAIAIELHNTKHQTAYALTIAKALVEEFGDISALRSKLTEDVTTLNQQLLLAGINSTSTTSQTTRTTRSTSSSSNSGCITGLIFIAVFLVISLLASAIGSCNSTSSSTKSSSYSQSSTSTATSYTVTLDRAGGSGGSSSITVSNGSTMPSARAPSRSGYDFKGYYSSPSGKGTKYYDADMNSAHTWDKSSDSTLYAYWVKKQEKKFSSSAQLEDLVYADIVSIFPTYGIYSVGGYTYSTDFSHFVCECKTSTGSTVWVYMTTDQYKTNFDSSVNTSRMAFSNNASEVSLSPSKRIHGTVIRANSIVDDLSDDTGNYIIEFSSIS